MNPNSPSLQSGGLLWPRSIETAEALLAAALGAHKSGTLGELLLQRPRVARWIVRRFLAPVLCTAGDRFEPETAEASSVALVLQWALHQLRPDHAAPGAPIDRACWLQQTSWRPMLAVMCHFGFEPVPDFREQYRRHPEESAADNLCGLWAVGPSTFYRYLEKGKQQMAERVLSQPLVGERRFSLRRLVHDRLFADVAVAANRAAWHESEATKALSRRDGSGALWHLLQASDVDGFTDVVNRFAVELAKDDETAILIEHCLRLGPPVRSHVELLLARAALWRSADDPERERQVYEQALQLANARGDKELLGVVYGALGRFHESRDTDRAFAYFEDSAEFLRQAGMSAQDERRNQVLARYLAALVKLAWQSVLRNDPRSRSVLDKAEQLRATPDLPDDQLALLEQAWGEYWRRAGELRRALDHKHRALNIYERLGDQRQILVTYSNLMILYGENKEFERAIAYGKRVLGIAERMPVDAYIVAGTRINLGSNLFWMADYAAAIEQHRLALDIAQAANLSVFAKRAHYNLAETFYKRYHAAGDPADETAGDVHVAEGLKADLPNSEVFYREAALNLKQEVLGTRAAIAVERLIPEEHAAHPEEMAEVQRSRKVLAVPAPAEAHVQARLNIARAYVAISMREREAALALIDKHGLGDRFAGEFDTLRSTFDRELTREQRLAAQWKQAAADLLGDERRAGVLAHVLHEGSINKSAYAEVCSVGAATASKHLATLAERGLLVQTGKGPSTKYRLPA